MVQEGSCLLEVTLINGCLQPANAMLAGKGLHLRRKTGAQAAMAKWLIDRDEAFRAIDVALALFTQITLGRANQPAIGSRGGQVQHRLIGGAQTFVKQEPGSINRPRKPAVAEGQPGIKLRVLEWMDREIR